MRPSLPAPPPDRRPAARGRARPVVRAALGALLLLLPGGCDEPPPPAAPPSAPRWGPGAPPKYVAAACNTREALDRAVAEGHTFVEVDLSWTSDGQLVLLPDWGLTLAARHGVAPGVRSLEAWRALPPPADGTTPLALDGLGAWLEAHPGISVVTDVQGEPVAAHALVAQTLPHLLDRFVAQVHDEAQHAALSALGLSRLVLTLERSPLPDEDVLALVERLPLLAVTLPRARVAGLLPRRLSERGVPSYGETFDEHLSLSRQMHRGLRGAYTTRLSPALDALARRSTDDWTAERGEVVPHDAQVLVLDAPVLGREGATLALGVLDGGPVREVRLTGWSADGRIVGFVDLVLPPGGSREARGLGAAFPGELPAWIAAPADVSLSVCWDVADRDPLCRRSTLESVRRLQLQGRGTGLAGVQLTVLNPGERPVGVQVEHDAGGGPVRAPPRELAPRQVLVELVPFETDGPVSISVSGGPFVVQPLRGDATLSIVH